MHKIWILAAGALLLAAFVYAAYTRPKFFYPAAPGAGTTSTTQSTSSTQPEPQPQPQPQPQTSSGIRGTVLLGPNCPVMQNPPTPQCADKPYKTILALTTPDGSRVIKTFESDTNGYFSVDAAPGSYAIRSTSTTRTLPYCSGPGTIRVVAGSYTKADVSCDTGIR